MLAEVSKLGYKPPSVWNFFHSSSIDAPLQLLRENVRQESMPFQLGLLLGAMHHIPADKQAKYEVPLAKINTAIQAWISRNPGFMGAAGVRPPSELDGDNETLPQCRGPLQAGDILTFEVGGPDFAEISGALSETAAESEALELRQHFEYGFGLHFEYGEHFDSYDGPAYKRYSKRVADFFANLGKGAADVVINIGKGLGDLTANVFKALGKGFVYTGAGVTALYASVRQTTSHTGDTKWTHTELALGPRTLMSAYGDVGIQSHSACNLHHTKIVISRFQGDGLVDASNYGTIVGHRAELWSQTLDHYGDTIGQWHRVILGKCLNVVGNAGQTDYWEAVTSAKVNEMWDYSPTYDEDEQGFWEGVKNSFRTHDSDGRRVKPKAMFCSKFVAALWSSVIGNPTVNPDEPVRHADVNKMLPWNPGACSPWTMVQWLTGANGRKYWKSCIADTAMWSPCR